MLRLFWHVSGNGSGRLHRGTVSLPQSIDYPLSSQTWYSCLDTSNPGWPQGNSSGCYIYAYIYTYIYTHIYIHTYIFIYKYISFMCGTDCGKRIYFMLSDWFSSSSGIFHTQLFSCMFVSHTRGCLGACVCVYMYWSNLHVYVYILQVYTH